MYNIGLYLKGLPLKMELRDFDLSGEPDDR